MHLRNKIGFGTFLACMLLASCLAFAQTQPASAPASSNASAQKVQPTPLPPDVDPSDPALPVWARPAQPAGGTKTADKTPIIEPQPIVSSGPVGEVRSNNGIYTISVQSREVTLPATVRDPKRGLVTNLQKSNFQVYEDGQLQQINTLTQRDVPVSIGVLVDNSGSMREKRAAVSKAVVNLVRSSNPDDEVFVVNFNDEPYLDVDFTNKVETMREALDRVDSRGGTALYDAVIAAADHLAKGGKKDKKVLLVVTDGEDNESRESLEQAIRAVQSEKGPTIYSIGILSGEGKQRRARRALEALSFQTGGIAFFPRNIQEVDEISQEVAKDIRHQYSLTYRPTNPETKGYRKVRVEAHAPGYGALEVRTKDGYFADENRASANAPQSR